MLNNFLKIALFIFTILLVNISLGQYAPMRYLTRGAGTDEIYLSCVWYRSSNSTLWRGIFRSPNNGKDLYLQRKVQAYQEGGFLYGDSMPGVVYQIPLRHIDTFGVSFDFGKTFQPKFFSNIFHASANCNSGEIYIQNVSGLYRSTDFGNTFIYQSQHDTIILEDIGSTTGEIYAQKVPGPPFQYSLEYSNDFGLDFNLRNISFPSVPNYYLVELFHGASSGEIYFFIWYSLDSIYLFHSENNGQTIQLKNVFLRNGDEVFFSGGKVPGTVYKVRRVEGESNGHIHSYVWIDFSRDYGETFTTYFHSLDSLYTSVPEEPLQIGFSFFPNPAYEKLTIEIPTPLISDSSDQYTFQNVFPLNVNKIEIINTQGILVYSEPIEKKKSIITINVSKWPRGMYIIGLRINNHPFIAKKLVIQ